MSETLLEPKASALPADRNLTGKYLTFTLQGESYGIDVLKVREIIRHIAITAGTPGVIPLVPRPGKGQGEDQVSLRRRRAAAPRNRSQAAGVTPAVVWGLVDALDDGVVLTDDDGVVVLANRRAEDMFGYVPGELIGQTVESLVPADLRAAHISLRAGYAQQPTARPMASRARLPGRRKDGSTFPVRVSLSPVPTATGRFILAVIRDVTEDQIRRASCRGRV